jgi:molybdenum cofactor synthesis domain-containing protein
MDDSGLIGEQVDSMSSSHEHEVCGSGFKHLTPVRDALRIVVSNLPKKPVEVDRVSVSMALGRVLAKDVVSEGNVPPFDRAAMDGFAVIAEDTCGASATAPVFLQSAGNVRIGVPPTARLKRGEAASIVTGGQMPHGANAVVMVEYTKQRNDGTIELSDEVHPAENVARVGEDVQRGAVILKRGTHILPQDLGMLSYLGLKEIDVARKLRVAILSTGNELHEGSGLVPGKIPDVNRPTLMGAVRELGCEPIDLGIVADDYEQIRSKLEQGIQTADMVLVTAGTSVGPGDIVPQVINSLGKPGMLVHGVAMRPSMPTGLAIINGKPIISLPGFPVSAYIAFLEFVPPLLSYMLDTKFPPRPTVKAKLSRRITGILGSKTYVRVLVEASEDGFLAEPVRTSGAGILSSLVQANGFIIVPEHIEGYEEGQLVDVELFRPPGQEQTVK